MRTLRWLLVTLLTAAILAGCGDKKTTSTDKTPPPTVEVAPSTTTSVVLPEVNSGEPGGQQVSPLATPANALSPLATPTLATTP